MTKEQIISDLAKNCVVERMISRYMENSRNRKDYPEDLAQEIYLTLSEKKAEDIEKLYSTGIFPYFLLRAIRNSLISRTSRYYYKYIKNEEQNDDIEKYIGRI